MSSLPARSPTVCFPRPSSARPRPPGLGCRIPPQNQNSRALPSALGVGRPGGGAARCPRAVLLSAGFLVVFFTSTFFHQHFFPGVNILHQHFFMTLIKSFPTSKWSNYTVFLPCHRRRGRYQLGPLECGRSRVCTCLSCGLRCTCWCRTSPNEPHCPDR